MFSNFFSRVQRYNGLFIAAAWVGILLVASLLRTDQYGIDENAAKSLLITWTVWERVTTPIVTLGPPDLRALIYIPLGAYWPGSMLAAKVFSALLTFLGIFILYRHIAATLSDEVALLASGLLLIAPLTLLEINQLGAGPHLLLAFSVGIWAHRRYLEGKRQLGGWYFLHMFLAIYAISLHPAGLAYPIAFAWEWWRNSTDKRQQKQFFLGLGVVTLLTLLIRFGWPGIAWLQNPIDALSTMWVARLPDAIEPMWSGFGLLSLLLAVVVIIGAWPTIVKELWGRLLFAATILGIGAADTGWAFMVQILIIYLGLTLLLRVSERSGGQSFAKQRGFVLAAIFILALVFMIGDKNYREANLREARSPQDQILYTLALELADTEERINIASQWPARTLLATKQPAFPLPPKNTPDVGQALTHVNYVVFDPFLPANQPIRDAIANVSGIFETSMIEDRAVLVKVRRPQTSTPQPPAAAEKPEQQKPEQPALPPSPPAPPPS